MGEICGHLAQKLAKPEGDGWHMVEYSTFTPPQVIGFNGLCNVRYLTVKKIISHIIQNFMEGLIPKLWRGDIKVHVCSASQFKSSLSCSRPLRGWHVQIYYVVHTGKHQPYFSLTEMVYIYVSLLKLHFLKGEHSNSWVDVRIAFSAVVCLVYLLSFLI